MSLTPTQYQDMMNEYDQIRRSNYQLEQDRTAEVYALIPEIEQIDQGIASESLSVARKMLFKKDDHLEQELHEYITSCARKKRELLITNHFPADYLEPVYHCSYCKDTGYVGDRKCSCFEKRIRDMLCHQSNLEEAIKSHNFSNFRLDYYSQEISPGMDMSPRDNMRKVLSTSSQFIRDLKTDPGRNLLIHGRTGRGKTFLSTCIAAEAIKIGVSVIYMTAYQLFEQLSDYTFRREENVSDPRPMLMDVDLLIIDDLGTEMNNSFTNSQLFLCINERILHKKSTIINTNLSSKQLSSTYTERIFSRLIQFYTFLNLYGKDIRYKKTLSPID